MTDRIAALQTSITSRCEALAAKLRQASATKSGDLPSILALARPLAEAGLLGLTIAEDKGGQAMGILGAVIAIEEAGRRWPAAVDLPFLSSFGAARLLSDAATPEQCQRILRPVLDGHTILPMAITEPDAGSAASDVATTARAAQGLWHVSGTKRFVAHVEDVRQFVVAARFGPGVENIGAVVIAVGSTGLTMGPRQHFMSGEPWCVLRMDAVELSPLDVIMKGGLFTRFGALFECDKLGTAARALGIASHAFEAARSYAIERTQFGRALCEFQSVQARFAEMDARLTAARLVLRAAAEAADHGRPLAREAAMAKLLASEAAQHVCQEAMQLMGATGYSDLTMVEYCLRKAHGLTITSGTNALLKVKLAESVFGRRFPQAAPAG